MVAEKAADFILSESGLAWIKMISIETFSNEFIGWLRSCNDTGALGWGQTCSYNANIVNANIAAQIVYKHLTDNILL
jgi:hypothetical protein